MSRGPWRSCLNKRRWPLYEQADSFRFEQQKRGDYLRTYFCRYCAGWHLTHSKAR